MTTLAHLERTYLHYLAFDNKANFTKAVLGDDLYAAYTNYGVIINAEIDRLNKIHVVAAINHLNATNKDEFNTAFVDFDKKNKNLDSGRYSKIVKIVNGANDSSEVSKPANDVTTGITELIQKIHNKILNSAEFQTNAIALGFQPNTVANLKSASKAFNIVAGTSNIGTDKKETVPVPSKPAKTNNNDQQQATAIAVAIAEAMSLSIRK